MNSRHQDEWLRAERVLRARAARQGCLFRQVKRRDTQLAAQLTSLGKLCDVARGSPAMSLLVSVATRVQGLSVKLLAFNKRLEDHEVAVLELEKQVQVLEEEKVVQRMVQMEERLSEEVLCLNVGLSQTDTALRAVVHKLWDLDEVVARVSALDEAMYGVCEPLQELSVCQCTSRICSSGVRTSLQISVCAKTASRTWSSGVKSLVRACERCTASPGLHGRDRWGVRDGVLPVSLDVQLVWGLAGSMCVRCGALHWELKKKASTWFSARASLYGEGDLASSSIRISFLRISTWTSRRFSWVAFIDLTMKVWVTTTTMSALCCAAEASKMEEVDRAAHSSFYQASTRHR